MSVSTYDEMLGAERGLAAVAAGAAIATIALGALVLMGWFMGFAPITNLNPLWVTMKVNTALSFLLSGTALLLTVAIRSDTFRGRWAGIAVGAAIASAILPVVTLAEYATQVDLGVDEFLLRDWLSQPGSPFPGRMALETAISFICVNAGIAIRGAYSRTQQAHAASTLSLPALGIALLSFSSYVYAVPVHAAFRGNPVPAAHTAVGLLILTTGLLASWGTLGLFGVVVADSDGGTVARRLFPAVIFVPLLLGWILVERQRAGHYNLDLGLALFAASNMVVFGAVVWWSADSLHRSHLARRRSARDLDAAERRFRAIIEHSADGMALANREGVVVYQSPGAYRMTGRTADERGGRSFADFVHPEDVGRWQSAQEAIAANPAEVVQIEVRYHHPDGNWRWIEAALSNMLADSDVGAMVANYRDITARKEAEKKRLESDERFRQMTEHITQAFFVVDVATGEALYMSPTWAQIWGRLVEESYDRTVRVGAVHPDDREAAAIMQASLRRGDPVEQVLRIVRPDQSVRTVRSRAYPVRDPSGTVYRYVGVAEDITELRETEERYLQAQKLEAMGRLAGGVAHDFNNLITVILAESEMIQARVPERPDVIEMLEDVRRAGDSAAVLTRQLLAFSRRQLVEPESFVFNDLVQDTSRMLRRLLGENVRLVTQLGADTGTIFADRGQMEQVLTNLAVNARDAMPRGGTLTIKTTVQLIDGHDVGWPDGIKAGPYVLLSVSDTGMGMSADVIAKAFDPFFTTKEIGKGTGLGLATCQMIVARAGGHITLESQSGMGTTVRVWFPKVADVPTRQRPGPEFIPRGDETILLVEDEVSVRNVAARMLRGQGYTVIETRDGEEALHVVDGHRGPLHLLLTDVVLPGMSGRELADAVLARRSGTRVLYASGYSDDAILQHRLLARDATLIHKPYTRAGLAQRVRAVLSDASTAERS